MTTVRETHSTKKLSDYSEIERRTLLFESVFKRKNIDSGFKYDPVKDANQIKSAEQHLTRMGVHPDNYADLYEIALSIHSEEKSPFNTFTLIKAAGKLKEKLNRLKVFNPVVTKVCDVCKGTGIELRGLMPVMADGKKKECRCRRSVL